MVQDCFLREENINLLFNSDIVNILLKTNVRTKKANVVIFECFNCRWEVVKLGRWEDGEAGKVEG